MDSDIVGSILLQVVLIAVNAVFACAEIAVVSCNDAKLEKMAQEGNKKAAKLFRLTEQPSRFLATIQVVITLSGFLGSAFAAENFSGRFVSVLVDAGVQIPEKTLDAIAVVLITLLLSYITLIFGELVPKRLAMHNSEKIALGVSGLVTTASKIFAPLVGLLTVSTNGILRLFGIDPNEDDDQVTEEEIRMMVDAGSEKGTIDNEEKDMIQNVFEFDDLTIDEICVHRTDVDLLWVEDSIEEWEQLIHESRHSYYPVCGETVDDIIGVLDAKDYFRLRFRRYQTGFAGRSAAAAFLPELSSFRTGSAFGPGWVFARRVPTQRPRFPARGGRCFATAERFLLPAASCTRQAERQGPSGRKTAGRSWFGRRHSRRQHR